MENLFTLSLGSLFFDGSVALAMHNRSIVLLRKELSAQILDDGGHEERSSTYHTLILDRLVEFSCVYSSFTNTRPEWLNRAITSWLNG